MRTFLTSPIPPSQCPKKIFHIREHVATALGSLPGEADLVKYLFKILKTFFPLDHVLLAPPSEDQDKSPFYIHPCIPPGEEQSIPRFSTVEQSQAILKSARETVVRIAGMKDRSITGNALARQYPGQAFSMLWLRSNIGGKCICTLTLLSRKDNVYKDSHAAAMFVLSDVIIQYWTEQALALGHPYVPSPAPYLELARLPGMEKPLKQISQITRQECPVLILGETGTGKEIAAKLIYRGSTRYGFPYIKINCGSIPENLVESELFGHEKGAFTGAVHTMKGKFERADNGVLLLDELGELPLAAQTKLLRVLQENVIERVGGEREIHLDVRILAATHQNLGRLIGEGRFRSDLYYRLNVFPIHIPPLRERPQDIPVLLDYFIRQACVKQGFVDVPKLYVSQLKQLCAYSWPGNIRELQNVVERSIIMWDGLKKNFAIEPDPDNKMLHVMQTKSPQTANNPLENHSLDAVCAAHIQKVLKLCNGKISGRNGAAELLGLKPTTLRFKMRKLGILPEKKI